MFGSWTEPIFRARDRPERRRVRAPFSSSDRLMSQRCHKQSPHNAPFGNAASLADHHGFGSRSHSSRSSNAALRNTDRLAIDDGIGWPGTHGSSKKQREPNA